MSMRMVPVPAGTDGENFHSDVPSNPTPQMISMAHKQRSLYQRYPSYRKSSTHLKMSSVPGYNNSFRAQMHDAIAKVSVLILEVNTLKSQFTCDLELEMRYTDNLMKAPPGVNVDDDIGFVSLTQYEANKLGLRFPRVMLENCEEFKITFDDVSINFNTNEVLIQTNWIAVYHEILELHRFPWDRQLLRLYIQVAEIDPVVPEKWIEDGEEGEPFKVKENLTDFSYYGYKAMWLESSDPAFDATCQITIELERNPTFYIYNYGIVIFLIVLINSATFVFVEVDNRLTYSAGLFLTLTAFKFVIMTSTPVVSYLTLLDRYVLLAFFFLFLGVVETVVTSERMQEYVEFDRKSVDSLLSAGMFFIWIGIHVMLLVCVMNDDLLRHSWRRVYEHNSEGILFHVGTQKHRDVFSSKLLLQTQEKEKWSVVHKEPKSSVLRSLISKKRGESHQKRLGSLP